VLVRYVGTCSARPALVAYGKTIEEARANTAAEIEGYFAVFERGWYDERRMASGRIGSPDEGAEGGGWMLNGSASGLRSVPLSELQPGTTASGSR
jgi:hypothetical protein